MSGAQEVSTASLPWDDSVENKVAGDDHCYRRALIQLVHLSLGFSLHLGPRATYPKILKSSPLPYVAVVWSVFFCHSPSLTGSVSSYGGEYPGLSGGQGEGGGEEEDGE